MPNRRDRCERPAAGNGPGSPGAARRFASAVDLARCRPRELSTDHSVRVPSRRTVGKSTPASP
jgi:hypothetical protein